MTSFATVFSNSILLAFIAGIPLYAAIKRVNVFDAFITGAQQSFDLTIRLIPYLVAMLVAIGMLRASGFFECLSVWLSPVLTWVGMPPELLPLALIRPFSGSASIGIMAELMHEHGGNSFISNAAATMMGSTETTFYVIAVYFGAVNIKRTRHAIVAGLLADLTGIVATIGVCHYFFD